MGQGGAVRRVVAPLALTVLLALLAGCGAGDGPPPLARADPSTTTTPGDAPPPPPIAAPPVAPAPAPALPPVPGGDGGVVVTATGVVAPVLAALDGAWRVTTPCGAEATVPGTPVAGAHVVLDPGHGGVEKGAIGPNGLTEAEVNLAVAREAQRQLEAAGVTVVLTRTADYRVPLGVRADVARRLAPYAFVSIHHNADPDGPFDRPGSETYFQIGSPDSRRLAGILYEESVAALAPFDVAWVGDTDAGAKFRPNSRGGDYYGILRLPAGITTVLAELAFISNPAEEALLATPQVQAAEAAAITRGVLRYLTTDDAGSGFTDPYPRDSPAGPGGGSSGCVDPPL